MVEIGWHCKNKWISAFTNEFVQLHLVHDEGRSWRPAAITKDFGTES